MANIEHELRGRLTQEEFERLETYLKSTAKQSIHNNKETHFFVVPKGLVLKVVKRSDNSAFISFKVGDETVGGLEEYEIPIEADDILKTVTLFKNLGYKYNYVPQRRTDYLLENDVEIALKNTPDWGYHFEIEYVGDTSHMTSSEVLKLLDEICTKLGIKPMTSSEIEAFIYQINQKL